MRSIKQKKGSKLAKVRTRKKYISKGQRKNVADKFDIHTAVDKAMFKLDALRKKKKVYNTIPNPDKANTKERFIRVLIGGANAL